MAGNKLEIDVTADTSSAQKEIKGLSSDLKDVGKAADDANSAAAKSSDSLANSLKGVRDALPTSADSKGIESIGAATLQASKSTAITETAFQRLGRTLSTLGSTLGRTLSSAFSGLGSIALSAGRAIGIALGAGLAATGIGAIALLVATFGKKLMDLITFAKHAGEQAAKALTDAFQAGMTVPDFRAFEGLFRAFGVGAEDANKFAISMGELKKQLLQGGDQADRISAIIKALGGDIQDFTGTADQAAAGLFKIRDGFNTLDALRRNEILKSLFPGVPPSGLAALDNALRNTNKTTLDIIATLRQYQTEQGKVDQQTSALAAAWAKAMTSADGFWNTLTEVTGAQAAYDGAISQTVEALNAVSRILDFLSGKIGIWAGQLGKVFEGVAKSFNDIPANAPVFWQGQMQEIANVVSAGGHLISQAWQVVVDDIIAIWGTLVGAAQAIVDKVVAVFTAGWNKIKQLGNSMGSFFSSGGSVPTPQLQQNRRALPIAPSIQSSGPGFRMFAATPTPLAAMGLAAARAGGGLGMSSSTVGSTAWAASLDDLIFRYKDVAKAAKAAGEAGNAAGQSAASGGDLATKSWGKLSTAQQEWLDNFNRMQDAYDELNSSLASFGEQATLSFIDAAMAGEDLRDVLAGLLKDLAKLLLQQLVLKPLFGSMFPTSSSFGGLSAAGLSAAGSPAGLMAANANLMRATPTVAATSGLSNIQGRASLSRAISGAGAAAPVNTSVGDVNIDMSKTGLVTGDSEQARQFGIQVQKAVQVVLVQESRPGGLLRSVG
jgi:hypothetical protein